MAKLSTLLAADNIQIKPPAINGSPLGIPSSTDLGSIITNGFTLIIILSAIGVLAYMLWGAVEWIFSGGEKEKVASARQRITHAIIGLVLLALVFFAASLIGSIVGIDPTDKLQLPSLKDPV